MIQTAAGAPIAFPLLSPYAVELNLLRGRGPRGVLKWGALAANVTGGGRVGGNIAGHGTPWDYDRRVPILFWKPSTPAQERFLPIRSIDIAPTLATVIGIQPPSVSGRALPLWY